MYQSCSNASSGYVAGRGVRSLDDWSYSNFQVLSMPPPACYWLAQALQSLVLHIKKKKNGGKCNGKQNKRAMDRWRVRPRDEGSKCCGSPSLSKVSSLDWPAALLSPFPHLFLFPSEGTCWENLCELLGLSALPELLKTPPLKEQCRGWVLDKALGRGRTYTIGWVFMKGPPVCLLLRLRLLIGTLWSAVYLPFIILTQAEAAGKSKRLSSTQTPGSCSAPSLSNTGPGLQGLLTEWN